jgi:hypothetical protein
MEPDIKVQQDTQLRSKNEMLERCLEDQKRGVMSEVYEWEFPKVLDAPIPVVDVATTVTRLYKSTVKAFRQNPSWDNERVRTYLRKKVPAFEDMAARTHPHLFTMITDKDLTPQNLKRIQELMAIRHMHEKNADVETNTKVISSYFQQEFYKPSKK